MGTKSDHMDRKLLVAAILAGVLSITIATVFIAQSASAQTNNATNMNNSPQINGSINVQQQANKFIQDNVKVSFNTAASTAQAQVDGGAVVAGHLGVVQGYLVYTFNVVNYDQGTSKIVIVDAGDGQVLFTSDSLPLQHGGVGVFGGGPMAFGKHHGELGMKWGGMHKGMMTATPSSSSFSSGSSNIQDSSV
jgi:uncharacterized membrane protein YkoI